MLQNSRIEAVVFFVKNLHNTRQFYEHTLGLKTTWAAGAEEGDSGGHLMAHIGDSVLIFFEGDEKPARTPILVFSVGDNEIHRMVEHLTAHHVEILAPVQHAPDGGLTADFADPDGHVLSIYQRPT
ncbi:VOC family protein [Microbulbifer sp. 2205BS26-8]|uniref:VOC family protein n=1 Tax=Microbulbifer sp. 2205BS26-8 TaxID=3064386 RepID=UPI00273E05B6|nr:VOC family protein [Microbulbifer sp. 2205BS26-8]MDP5208398.1 VOC family protein [Microbulbifer sp. 2205BS26-8]